MSAVQAFHALHPPVASISYHTFTGLVLYPPGYAYGLLPGDRSIYRALAIAMGTLDPTHKPDYTKTEPAVPIPPQPAWSDPSKIVSFDPWGHLVPQVYRRELEELGLDVRPSIAAHEAQRDRRGAAEGRPDD